jgi:hypothetical protein
MDSAFSLSDNLVTAFQQAIARSIHDWLNHHPVLNWLLHHGLITLGLVLLFLLLIWGLIGAIARSLEQGWFYILQLPFRFVFWVMKGVIVFGLQRFHHPNPLLAEEEATQSFDNRLAEILSRMESLRMEQDELLQEMKLLLGERGDRS